MTTPLVQSITDEQLAEIELFLGFGGSMLKTKREAWVGVITRLRAAEKDSQRLDWLDRQVEAYGFEVHEGNRWIMDGPFRDLRTAIDEAMKNDH